MSVIGYSFEEAMASLRRSGRSAVMSIGTIAIAFATLGGFLLVSVNLQSVLNRWLEAAEMSVYLVDGVTDEERSALEQFVRAQPEVAAVEFVSRERALERFRVDFPELRDVADGVGENPFPSAIEVRLKGSLAGDASAEQLSRQIAGRAGVADVRYDRRWLARLIGIVASVRIGGALVAAILMLGAAFTVGAVVRLSLYARRDELEIMQLVGAPFGYIRGPFVTEGLLLGVVGAAVAVLVVAGVHAALVRAVGADVSGITGVQQLRFLGWQEMAGMVVGGLVVGALSGTVASRAVR